MWSEGFIMWNLELQMRYRNLFCWIPAILARGMKSNANKLWCWGHGGGKSSKMMGFRGCELRVAWWRLASNRHLRLCSRRDEEFLVCYKNLIDLTGSAVRYQETPHVACCPWTRTTRTVFNSEPEPGFDPGLNPGLNSGSGLRFSTRVRVCIFSTRVEPGLKIFLFSLLKTS
jgi:hypothetical protein